MPFGYNNKLKNMHCNKRFGKTEVTSTVTELLDDYTTILGWDFKQLKTDQPKCLRVRRDSDNEEIDINYVDSYIDSASLLSFVGAGNNGYVTTLYDCNGLHNLTQSTLSKQPMIVENGVFLSDGIKFNSTYETSFVCNYFSGMYRLTPPFCVYSSVYNYAMDNASRVLFQDWNVTPKWGSRINTGGYQYQLTSSTWIYGQHIVVGVNICMFNWESKSENGFIQYSNNYDPIYDTVSDDLTDESANFYVGSLDWDTAGDFQLKGFAIFPQLMDFAIFNKEE
jgi:hypothetical protein